MPEVLQPRKTSSRNRARELFEQIDDDLRDTVVEIDFEDVRAAAPSFIDELLHVCLEERGVAKLKVVNVTPTVARFIDQSAARRKLRDRIYVDRKP